LGNRLTLVDVGLGVVGHFVLLVDQSILGSGGTSADAGIVVLGDLLVGLLGSLSSGALDSLADVLSGVLNVFMLVMTKMN
jgi:hypothetical protein